MSERIIVSLTTWAARIENIPTVLDTIFAQTQLPDKVVINVAYELEIPINIQNYIAEHKIELYRCNDTKVYKKIIPTLKRYPNDCIISIDDDWLYPKNMIADFMDMHMRYPNNPISGNEVIMFGMQCHCGCASLIKYDYFGKYLDCINDEIISSCLSDDMVYTFFSNKNGHPYLRSKNLYFTNMHSYNAESPYSDELNYFPIQTFSFLVKKYGDVKSNIYQYVHDETICSIMEDIEKTIISEKCQEVALQTEIKIKNSFSYRLGNIMLMPVSMIRKILH